MANLLDPPMIFSTPVLLCPSCAHGIDPHGVDPGGYCGVGELTEDDGGLINVACKCLWSPNDIAYVREQEARERERDQTERAMRSKVLGLTRFIAVEEAEMVVSWEDLIALFGGED